MTELKLLDTISKISGKNDKLKLLKDNSNNIRLAQLLDAVFNYKRLFYINKVDLSTVKVACVEADVHDEFLSLLALLEARIITGHDAINAVVQFLNKCSEFQQTWYLKVLRKDLKAGFSVDTAIKAGFNIPVFDVMLAKDGKTCKKLKSIVEQGVYASPKFDGYRCLAEIKDGDVTLFSREGSIYNNFPTIEESLSRSFPKGEYIFDGEIMSDNFQSMQKSAFANKRGTTVGDVKFFIFGYVDYNEWKTQSFKQTTRERLAKLNDLSKSFDDKLILVEHKLIKSLDVAYNLEQNFLLKGYEGAMLLPNVPYYLGKVSNKMLKLKTFESQDCEVIDFYEGKNDTKLENSLGGIIVIQENGNICKCGSGFSEEDRDYMWANKDEFIGKKAEIKYQNLTDDGIMRFPVFIRWRNDKV